MSKIEDLSMKQHVYEYIRDKILTLELARGAYPGVSDRSRSWHQPNPCPGSGAAFVMGGAYHNQAKPLSDSRRSG